MLSRDGTDPLELIRISREQLKSYETIEWLAGTVDRVTELSDSVEVRYRPLERNSLGTLPSPQKRSEVVLSARVALLACGSIDLLPQLPGFNAIYGKTGHHCPFCDGYEYRNKRIMVYGRLVHFTFTLFST